jgi:hypothetical protein
MSRPRGPGFLIPRHIGIEHMFELPRSPHGDHGGGDFFGDGPVFIRLLGVRNGPSLTHDERGGAGRICRGEERRRRECARPRDQRGTGASDSVEHRSDAVSPLLQGWHRARLHRIGSSTAWLVENDEPTERSHRLNPPLDGWQLRKVLAASKPIRNEHDVANARG